MDVPRRGDAPRLALVAMLPNNSPSWVALTIEGREEKDEKPREARPEADHELIGIVRSNDDDAESIADESVDEGWI